MIFKRVHMSIRALFKAVYSLCKFLLILSNFNIESFKEIVVCAFVNFL